MIMNLKRLFYFTTLAKVGNFTRAAEELHISQPSLSYAIKQLEKNTDTILFERHEGGVILTDIGKQFYNISKELISHYDEVLTEFETIKETGTGTISIGMIEAVKNWVPKIISDHQNTFDHVNYELYEILNPSEMISSLKSYHTHLCISNYLIQEDFTAYETLYEEEFAVVAKPGYFPSTKKEVSVAELKGVPLILSPNKYLTQQNILQAFNEAKIKPNIKLKVEKFETACTCVEAGLGIAFVPKNFILYSRFKELQTLKPINPTPVRSVYIVYHKNRTITQSVKHFINLCKTFGKQIDLMSD